MGPKCGTWGDEGPAQAVAASVHPLAAAPMPPIRRACTWADQHAAMTETYLRDDIPLEHQLVLRSSSTLLQKEFDGTFGA